MKITLQSSTSPVEDTKTWESLSGHWNVIVLNDPVNTMPYVVMVFRKVFGFSQEKARKHMLEVHQQGRSLLWSGDREKAEAYAHTLQKWQLTAILDKDDSN